MNGLFVDERNISAPAHLLPGSNRTHLFAELGHQMSAHHVWSRRRISHKHHAYWQVQIQFGIWSWYVLVLPSLRVHSPQPQAPSLVFNVTAYILMLF